MEVKLRKILFKKLRGHQYCCDLEIYWYPTVQGTCQGVYWGTDASEFSENTAKYWVVEDVLWAEKPGKEDFEEVHAKSSLGKELLQQNFR